MMNSRHFPRFLAATALCSGLLLSSPATTQAAGFYIQEQSVSGLGNAFAGSAATAEDASVIYFNPAGMTDLDRAQVQVGAHVLIPSAELTSTGSTVTNVGGTVTISSGTGNDVDPYEAEAVPNFFAAYPLNSNNSLWVGFGMTAPFGLGNDYGDDWFGRYDSTKSELVTLNFSPSIAWAPYDWLSIGGGLDIQYANAELEEAIPSPLTATGATPATDGLQNLSGDDTSVGFNIGAILKPTDTTRVGLHYRSAISHELEGRVTIEQPTDVPASDIRLTGEAGLDLPDIATFSVAQMVTPQVELLASATWFGWSRFDSIPVAFDNGTNSETLQNYEDTWAFSVGANYMLDDQWTLRAGYQYDETPTQDGFRSTVTPDGDRNWFALGVSYEWNDDITVDFSGTYIDVSEETIDLSRTAVSGATSEINATTGGDVGIIAVGLTYRF